MKFKMTDNRAWYKQVITGLILAAIAAILSPILFILCLLLFVNIVPVGLVLLGVLGPASLYLLYRWASIR